MSLVPPALRGHMPVGDQSLPRVAGRSSRSCTSGPAGPPPPAEVIPCRWRPSPQGRRVVLISGHSLRLAPVYDVVSTLVYEDDQLAMFVDNVHQTTRVTAERLISEARRWGISRRRAEEVVTDLLDRVPAAAEAARDEIEGLPASVPAAVDSQLTQVRRISELPLK